MTIAVRLTGWGWRAWLPAVVFAWVTVVGTFAGAADAAPLFILAGVFFIVEAAQRRWPAIDEPLLALAIAYAALCWASTLWSIVPRHTALDALQLTLIFVGSLLLLAQAKELASVAEATLRVASIGAIVGAALALADFRAGFPIMHNVMPSAAPYAMGEKMGRGLAYLALLAWPIAGYAWQTGRRAWAIVLGTLVAVLIAQSFSDAVLLSLCCGLVAFAAAWFVPAIVAWAISLLAAIAAFATPFIVVAFGDDAMGLARTVKFSAAHRLEIWDYMSRRLFERPILGWGWSSASALPIKPEELARYQYVTAAGTPHPHGNWLQLWVETGILGPVLGLGFALLVVWRAKRMPPAVRPFALACCMVAFVQSLASFDLDTDSWWTVLAATALLFKIAPWDSKPTPA